MDVYSPAIWERYEGKASHGRQIGSNWKMPSWCCIEGRRVTGIDGLHFGKRLLVERSLVRQGSRQLLPPSFDIAFVGFGKVLCLKTGLKQSHVRQTPPTLSILPRYGGTKVGRLGRRAANGSSSDLQKRGEGLFQSLDGAYQPQRPPLDSDVRRGRFSTSSRRSWCPFAAGEYCGEPEDQAGRGR